MNGHKVKENNPGDGRLMPEDQGTHESCGRWSSENDEWIEDGEEAVSKCQML